MRTRSVWIGTLAAVTIVAAGTSSTASDQPDALIDTVASTVEAVAPDAEVLQPVEASNAFVAGTATAPALIPVQPDGDVTLSSSRGSITVGLPGNSSTATGSVAEDGTVVYPSTDGATLAVQALEGSVRILSVIPWPDVSGTFTYPLDLPADANAELLEDGSVLILGADGAFLGGFAQPWAVDADGAPVPTHYLLDGGSLVQVVEHDPDAAYPIVADPWLGVNLIAGVSVTNESQGRHWSYSLSAWGHYWSRRAFDGSGQSVMLTAGWNEAKAWAPTVDSQNLHDQWNCHAFGGLIVTGTWDLESWRGHNTSQADWIRTQCNW